MKRIVNTRSAEGMAELGEAVRLRLPHFASWYVDEESFGELRLKARDDGTTLAIAKGYGPDGGAVVCFGSGYGLIGALIAIDATIQGGRWRVDKPWQPDKK